MLSLRRSFQGHPSSSVDRVNVRVLEESAEIEIVITCRDGRVLDAQRFRLDAKTLPDELDRAFISADETKIEITLNAYLIDSIMEWLRDESRVA